MHNFAWDSVHNYVFIPGSSKFQGAEAAALLSITQYNVGRVYNNEVKLGLVFDLIGSPMSNNISFMAFVLSFYIVEGLSITFHRQGCCRWEWTVDCLWTYCLCLYPCLYNSRSFCWGVDLFDVHFLGKFWELSVWRGVPKFTLYVNVKANNGLKTDLYRVGVTLILEEENQIS